MKLERLQKILAQSGIASRRAAETMIEEGRVRVNGKIVRELGAKADPRQDRIDVDGTRIVADKKVYVVLHKPRGVVATMSDPEGRPTVKDYLERTGVRVVPVGRLDFATSGVLFATNDGDFAFALSHPKQKVPKTYVLKLSGEMQEKDLEQWRTGIQLDDGITHPADVKLIRYENGKTWLELTITEGRNQMIRRMGEKTGFPVMRLARTSFADISSDGLAPGKWRALDREELLLMKKKWGVPKSVPGHMEVGVDHRSAAKSPPRSDGRGRPIQDRRHSAEPKSWSHRDEAPTEHRPLPTDRFERKARGEDTRGARGDRPAPRGDRPAPRGDRPAPRGDRPAPRGDRPAPRGDRSAPRGDRPAPRGDRPPPRGDRSAPRGDRTAPRGDRSATRGDRPAPRGDRPPPRGDRNERTQRGARGPSDQRHAGVPPRGRSPHDRPNEDRPRNDRARSDRGAQGQGSRGGGSSASRSATWKPDEPQREGYGLGRSGRSRTTGSGGGIGAEEGDYRLRRTRRG